MRRQRGHGGKVAATGEALSTNHLPIHNPGCEVKNHVDHHREGEGYSEHDRGSTCRLLFPVAQKTGIEMRIASRLGLQRRQRDVTPTVEEYLRSKRQELPS